MERYETVLKQKYNELLKRHEKARAYMEDWRIPFSNRMKFESNYKEIVLKLNFLLELIKDSGGEVSDKEIQEGFDL